MKLYSPAAGSLRHDCVLFNSPVKRTRPSPRDSQFKVTDKPTDTKQQLGGKTLLSICSEDGFVRVGFLKGDI